MSALYADTVYGKLDAYSFIPLFLHFDMTRKEEYREPMFEHRWRRIKLAGVTISTKAQTACHYGTGRINITDNRRARRVTRLKQMLQPRPGFPPYSSLLRADTK